MLLLSQTQRGAERALRVFVDALQNRAFEDLAQLSSRTLTWFDGTLTPESWANPTLQAQLAEFEFALDGLQPVNATTAEHPERLYFGVTLRSAGKVLETIAALHHRRTWKVVSFERSDVWARAQLAAQLQASRSTVGVRP